MDRTGPLIGDVETRIAELEVRWRGVVEVVGKPQAGDANTNGCTYGCTHGCTHGCTGVCALTELLGEVAGPR